MFYVWYKLPKWYWCFIVFDSKENQIAGLKNVRGICQNYALGEGPEIDQAVCDFIGDPPKGAIIRKGKRDKLTIY